MPRTSVGSNTTRKSAVLTCSTVEIIASISSAVPSSRQLPRTSFIYRTPAISFVTVRNSSIHLRTSSAPYPVSRSSASTPSIPILSILSKMTNTLSYSSASKPQYAAIAFKILRLLIRIVKFLKSSLPSSVVVARISSISASMDGSPKISISHCINWRKRPLCGRSARHEFPIWSALNGAPSSFELLA